MKLLRPEGTLALRDWGEAICEQLAPLAQLLDQGRAEALYGPLLEAERRKLSEPELTPSARVVADWQASGLSYPRWMQQRCEQMQTELCQLPLEAEFAARAEAEVAASWEAQTEREASEHGEFEPFLAQFLTLKGQGLTA
jgi:glutamate--cysteine ligase